MPEEDIPGLGEHHKQRYRGTDDHAGEAGT